MTSSGKDLGVGTGEGQLTNFLRKYMSTFLEVSVCSFLFPIN